MFSCKTVQPVDKDYTLFQKSMDSLAKVEQKTPVVRPFDRISVHVFSSSINQEEVRIYKAALESLAGTEDLLGILIEADGHISLPQIGKLKVAELTTTQIEALIQEKLKPYIKNPGVSVRLLTFNVTVFGEVIKTGQVNLAGKRSTILDAIALSLGLNEYARRDSVLVIREEKGERKTYAVDLRNGNLFSSPAFYLMQNDIIYVMPNSKKLKDLVSDPTAITRRQTNVQIFGILLGSISVIINTIFILSNL